MCVSACARARVRVRAHARARVRVRHGRRVCVCCTPWAPEGRAAAGSRGLRAVALGPARRQKGKTRKHAWRQMNYFARIVRNAVQVHARRCINI
eukprot:2898086-Pleurochrysis_carterae.AAC.4